MEEEEKQEQEQCQEMYPGQPRHARVTEKGKKKKKIQRRKYSKIKSKKKGHPWEKTIIARANG